MRLFFFGTLIDADVRQAVVGRPLPVETATAAGFVRVFIAGRTYPMLLPKATGRVGGVLTPPLEDAALRRLNAYEGPEYRLRPITVETATGTVTAHAYFCRHGVAAGRREWRFEDWLRREKRSWVPRIVARMRRC